MDQLAQMNKLNEGIAFIQREANIVGTQLIRELLKPVKEIGDGPENERNYK